MTDTETAQIRAGVALMDEAQKQQLLAYVQQILAEERDA